MSSLATPVGRRDWLAMCLALPCAAPGDKLSFRDLPQAALPIARDLGITERSFTGVVEAGRKQVAARLEQGSAEHVTYYVLQSKYFTDHPPLDPVRLAAARPSATPPSVLARFEDFEANPATGNPRHQLLLALFRGLKPAWTAERCFRHTMDFLSARRASANQQSVDDLYQRRGLSADTSPAQTLVLDRAWRDIGRSVGSAPVLLAGPGLDLTRRESFSDDIPLKSHQADWLAARATLECMDVRPEIVGFLKNNGRCAFLGDVTHDIPRRSAYSAAFATNLTVYLDEQRLFLALAVLASALRPGGCLVHNDQRFAAKVFGDALGLPVTNFLPVTLGVRNGVAQMDRAVIHRRTVAPGSPE